MRMTSKSPPLWNGGMTSCWPRRRPTGAIPFKLVRSLDPVRTVLVPQLAVALGTGHEAHIVPTRCLKEVVLSRFACLERLSVHTLSVWNCGIY